LTPYNESCSNSFIETRGINKMNTFRTRSQARQFTSKANALIGESLYKAHSVKSDKGWNVSFKTGLLTLKKGV